MLLCVCHTGSEALPPRSGGEKRARGAAGLESRIPSGLKPKGCCGSAGFGRSRAPRLVISSVSFGLGGPAG